MTDLDDFAARLTSLDLFTPQIGGVNKQLISEWSDAVWLPVWQHAEPPPRLGYLWTDTKQMQPLLWGVGWTRGPFGLDRRL